MNEFTVYRLPRWCRAQEEGREREMFQYVNTYVRWPHFLVWSNCPVRKLGRTIRCTCKLIRWICRQSLNHSKKTNAPIRYPWLFSLTTKQLVDSIRCTFNCSCNYNQTNKFSVCVCAEQLAKYWKKFAINFNLFDCNLWPISIPFASIFFVAKILFFSLFTSTQKYRRTHACTSIEAFTVAAKQQNIYHLHLVSLMSMVVLVSTMTNLLIVCIEAWQSTFELAATLHRTESGREWDRKIDRTINSELCNFDVSTTVRFSLGFSLSFFSVQMLSARSERWTRFDVSM